MKQKFLAVAGIISIVLLTGALSFARMGGKGFYGYGAGTNAAPVLTQDQKDKIFKIQNTLQSDIASLKTDLQQANYDLGKALSASVIDEKQAKALHDKINSLQDKITDKRFQAELDILKVLTPEQRQAWSHSGMFYRQGMMNNGKNFRENRQGMMKSGNFPQNGNSGNNNTSYSY